MILSGDGAVADPRVAAQVGEPQHGADPLGDAAHDAAAQHPAAGVAAEIGLDQGCGDPGERAALQGQRQRRHQLLERVDLRRRSKPPGASVIQEE